MKNGVTSKVWIRPLAKKSRFNRSASPSPIRQHIVSAIAVMARVCSSMVQNSAVESSST
jgi:hypothetical protein